MTSPKTPFLAACRAATPLGFDAWAAAVCALGRASQAGFPEPPKPGRSTGLTRSQLYARLLKSHLFDADRPAWATVNTWATAAEMDRLMQEKETRQRAETTANRAAKAALETA